jgi:uncharacterized RDD family membrane protein YckC
MTTMAVNTGTTLYAGFWRRVVAYIIDSIVLSIVLGIVFAILGAVAFSGGSDSAAAGMIGIMYIIGIVAVWLYFALMESGSAQATLGKMALSIKVTDLEGRRISFGRATGRFFGKIISGLILYIGYMMAGWTEKKQALHDMMAGTLVIRSV